MRTNIAKKQPGIQLGAHHFAFFRSHLDALPLDVAADRYLETGMDLRQAKRTLEWIRQELIDASRRYFAETGLTQSSFRRLLRIDPEKLQPGDRVTLSDVPSLEEFQEDYDPTGFYSEAELIAEFQKRYGERISPAVLRITERNERLRQRTNRALKVLENWLATTPKPTDPLEIWLHPTISRKICGPETGIRTISELIHWINHRGHLWYRKIPGFGAGKAKRVISWLQLNKVLPLNELALVPFHTVKARLPDLRPKQSGIVPLEALSTPAELDGSQGANRGQQSRLEADTDKAAIEAWIAIKARGNKNTARSYRSQAERFLLWMLFEKGKPLSSASPEDFAEYTRFLAAMGDSKAGWPWLLPMTDWIAGNGLQRGAQRWHPDWRPFSRALTLASQRQAITVVKGLLSFLVRTRYLEHDPSIEIATPKRSDKRLNTHHVLSPRQWQAVLDELETLPLGEAYLRLRLALWMLYSTGLRLFELAGLKASHLHWNVDGWEIHLVGKGGREREIPLSASVLVMMQDYLEVRGFDRNPARWPAGTPILATLGNGQQHAAEAGKAMADSSLFKLLKRHFDISARRLDDLIEEQQLRQASTHWLRHTFATEILARGAGVDVAQELLGHADSATTALYTHASRERKRAAVEGLKSA